MECLDGTLCECGGCDDTTCECGWGGPPPCACESEHENVWYSVDDANEERRREEDRKRRVQEWHALSLEEKKIQRRLSQDNGLRWAGERVKEVKAAEAAYW